MFAKLNSRVVRGVVGVALFWVGSVTGFGPAAVLGAVLVCELARHSHAL